MPVNPGNLTTADIYRKTVNDPVWQADNFVFQIVRRLVKTGKCSRRHGMALWNLYQMKDEALSKDQLFHNASNTDSAYPALSESEACYAMDERGYVWVDPFFEAGEYFGNGYSDRWEPKGFDGK